MDFPDSECMSSLTSFPGFLFIVVMPIVNVTIKATGGRKIWVRPPGHQGPRAPAHFLRLLFTTVFGTRMLRRFRR